MDMLANFLRIVDRIESGGLQSVGAPHVKHLTGKLWEMRMKGKDGIVRSIYMTAEARAVFILHSFIKKSQKASTSALRLAMARAKEVER
jgi:phage-related protein